MSLCPECHKASMDWLDYDRTPVRGWKQYSASREHRARMSLEVRRIRLDDRAALIRRQCELIARICATKHQETTAA